VAKLAAVKQVVAKVALVRLEVALVEHSPAATKARETLGIRVAVFRTTVADARAKIPSATSRIPGSNSSNSKR
jgi:hypothetical protein